MISSGYDYDDAGGKLNTSDVLQSKKNSSKISYLEDVDDNIFNIIPTVNIRGLREEETLRDLVVKKQQQRGYEATNRILSKMEAKIIRFNPNLNNSHTLDDIYSGQHSFQRDDLEYLKPQSPSHQQIKKIEDSNDTLASIAKFLYPINKCNNIMAINSDSEITNQRSLVYQVHESPISDISIGTSLALEIENTINKQNMASESSAPIDQNDKNIQITPEGIVYNNEILLSEKQRTIKTLMDKGKNANTIQLDVPSYYKEVSVHRQNDDNKQKGNSRVFTRNVNNIYSYTHSIYYKDTSLHNCETSNEKISWLKYASNKFVKFWLNLYKNIKNIF